MIGAGKIIPVEAAYFPKLYDAARAALFRAEQIDECQEWSNRAAAMASYARQAKDRTLLDISTRIQARAVRRCGELLQQVPALRGHHGTTSGRTAVARSAGLSSYQQATALQVAQISEADFERQVEGNRPPTLTRLAEQGTRGTWHSAEKTRMAVIKRVKGFANLCRVSDPTKFHEVLDAGDVNVIQAWCMAFFEDKERASTSPTGERGEA